MIPPSIIALFLLLALGSTGASAEPQPVDSPHISLATPKPTFLSPRVLFFTGEAINALTAFYHDLTRGDLLTPGHHLLTTSPSLSIEISESPTGATLKISNGRSIARMRSFSRKDRRVQNAAQLQLWRDKVLVGDEAAAFLAGLDYIESHPSPYPPVNDAIKGGGYIGEFLDRGGPEVFVTFSYPDPLASPLTNIGCGFYARILIFNKATRLIREGEYVC